MYIGTSVQGKYVMLCFYFSLAHVYSHRRVINQFRE